MTSNNRPGTAADMTYTYDTLHGWLSGISSPSGFSELIQRENATNAQYSGNIGSTLWRNTSNGEQHKYDYEYDNLGRLVSSGYSSSANGSSGRFDETVQYNCQGAITSLQRNGMRNNGTYGIIDDLTINYDGNRLLSVTDDAESLNYSGALDFHDGANMTAEYEYDANGALTRDSNRGISSIVYDYSHNPHMIYFSSGSSMNDYGSDGRKFLSLHTTNASGALSTVSDMYIDGLVLRNGTPHTWQFDGGYITLNGNGAATSWNYYVTDHLGSTRKVVTSTNAVKETINYYPYGSEMTMTSPSQLTTNPDWQPFRFSGKELDKVNGLNMYDFGARWFDVAGVPAWTSVDPLAEDNCRVTPYSYCNGDPVNAIDPDGKNWISARYDNDVFVFFDSRISCIDDIEQYYGRNSSIKYIGTTGNISQIQGDGESHIIYILNDNGTFDKCGDGIINSCFLHIGNDKDLEKDDNGNICINNNWYGSYLGPNNPRKKSTYFYAVPPKDNLDYAAYLHDRAYDKYNASSTTSALFDMKVGNADTRLAGDALGAFFYSSQWNRKTCMSLATGISFSLISFYKNMINAVK